MTATNEFIQEDLDFIAELNDPSRGTPLSETLKADYLRNFDQPVLQQFENITRRVIDPNFVLCFSCSNEIMSMVRRVMAKYEAEQAVPEPQGIDIIPHFTDTEEAQTDLPPAVDLGESEAGEAIAEQITDTAKPKGRGKKA